MLETNNRVLSSLPASSCEGILGDCERVHLPGRTILDRVDTVPDVVHFPETAVISTIATYGDGSSIEMANIGREACTGIGLILGYPRQLNTNEVQLAGTALAMRAERFVEHKNSVPAFAEALLATVQAVVYQVMVSGACNGIHSAKQRLARWLLTMRDRREQDIMYLTHDFLAEMLGVRRATVTETLRDLQWSGLVAYSRGQVRITDPQGLHDVSCECYDLVRHVYEVVLPPLDRS